MSLNPRAEAVLESLVRRYINEGQPIGSRLIAHDLSSTLSSATIRHVMADLENKGYIYSPYTSAGRIPTAKAYRFFVNSILASQNTFSEMDGSNTSIEQENNLQSMMQATTHLLSDLTKMTAIISVPKLQRLTLRHIEFLPLSSNRILVILILNEQDVQNRIIESSQSFTESELQQVSSYLNEQFVGKELSYIQTFLSEAVLRDKQKLDTSLAFLSELAEQTFGQQEANDFVLAGETNLFDMVKQEELMKLRSLFDAFNQKQHILNLLDRCVAAQGIQIFIGEEVGVEVFQGLSVVTSPYSFADKVIGVVGVIGPERMPYDRVIPVVNMTAKQLSAAISQKK